MKFTARCITSQLENGVVTVGFADREFDTQDHVVLQRSLSPTPQDIALEQDRVHFDCNGNADYGDVVDVVISKGRIRIELEPAAADALTDGEPITLSLPRGGSQPKELIDRLRLLFPGKVRVAD